MSTTAPRTEFSASAKVFRSLVESRRAVRRFTAEAVPKAVIQDCLELAMLAPSSCNLQPWSFHVVRNPDLLQQLQPVCLGQSAAKAPLIIAVFAHSNTWEQACADVLRLWPEPAVPKAIEHFYKNSAPFQYNQGWLGWRGLLKRQMVRLMGFRRPVMRTPNSLEQMRLWAVKSTALAAQNLMLAFQSHGYSTCPMEGFDEKRLKQVLPVPKGAIPVMLLAVGMPGERAVYNPRLRFPLNQRVAWH
ncbi:nitroreductase family protein [Pseudomonas sp. TAE6080]|uniref:nitroreductase family protein n=1 Tax=Pseudomonas sp. TAE6080 TaxID=2840374 RepID=UPI001BFFE20F|nr:nitroreductase family protein [Pseudomonas sp. TAE6080]MBT9302493.1 nitroreductase family protein [Pseudomonas sp. TAE6080]